jgi:NitT/TauT family transport system permease protein
LSTVVFPAPVVPVVRKDPENMRDVFATIVVVAVLIAMMEVTSRYVPDYIMPSSLAVLKAAKELFFSDPYHVLVTLLRLTTTTG